MKFVKLVYLIKWSRPQVAARSGRAPPTLLSPQFLIKFNFSFYSYARSSCGRLVVVMEVFIKKNVNAIIQFSTAHKTNICHHYQRDVDYWGKGQLGAGHFVAFFYSEL